MDLDRIGGVCDGMPMVRRGRGIETGWSVVGLGMGRGPSEASAQPRGRVGTFFPDSRAGSGDWLVSPIWHGHRGGTSRAADFTDFVPMFLWRGHFSRFQYLHLKDASSPKIDIIANGEEASQDAA